ncbi:MAG: chemotaxis protein CheW [Bosea sp. (in: a-proteobacteria)]
MSEATKPMQNASPKPANANSATAQHDAGARDFVTLYLGDQMFGLPIDRVHDVFVASQIAGVPLAPREIVGLLNLRGKVVTALSLRARLGMAAAEQGADETTRRDMAIGIDHAGEAYALMVDKIGEVMRLDATTFEANPLHLNANWMALSSGVHRLDGKLLVILDVDAVLDFEATAAA